MNTDTNKEKQKSFSLSGAVLSRHFPDKTRIISAVFLAACVIIMLWQAGAFLPSWIEWKEGSGSYLLGKEEPKLTLKNKIMHVMLNNDELWNSKNGCLVSDFLTGDVDHDGDNELILLFWRRGSFGEHLPFWIKRNDRSWSQHIGVYDWKEEYSYRLDPAWVSSRLGMEISKLSMDDEGVVTVVDTEGEESRWYWRSWGLSKLEEGEKPFSMAHKRLRSEEEQRKAAESPLLKSISFTASGDNLIHEPVFRAARDKAGGKGYDFGYAYEGVADFFKGHDINLINAESLITSSGEASDYPYFETPSECGEALACAGFDVFCLSNNHIYDKGPEGVNGTDAFYKGLEDTLAFGLYDREALYDIPMLERDGVRVSFLGYTYGTNLPEPLEADKRVVLLDETDIIKEQLRLARDSSDIVVVSCHFGNENSHEITDSQRAIAKTLADWGADLIIGTHPHVIQDAGWFNTKDGRRALVCYSLGNFLSSMKWTGQLLGLTLECRFEGVPGGKFIIKDAGLKPNVTVYGPYFKEPRVKWLSDYSREEAEAGRRAYGDIDYSYDRIIEILTKNVSEEFLDMEGIEK